MPNYSEILNLESDTVEILGDTYYGYASNLIQKKNKSNLPYVASCFAIAGVLKSIASPGSGTSSFINAARYYYELGNSYWVVCAICANDFKLLFGNAVEEKWELNYLERLLLTTYNRNFFSFVGDTANLSAPIGRLRMPAYLLGRTFQEVIDFGKTNQYNISPLYNTRIFLERASESIRILQDDSFHWKNLYGSLIPLEPELLAFCIALCKILSESEINFNSFIENLHLDPLPLLPLNIAKDLWDNKSHSF